MQAGPVPTDNAGQPFKYLQQAPLPMYQANMPSLDKVIFSSPGTKRKREGKGFRHPRITALTARSRKELKKRTLLNLTVLLLKIHPAGQTKLAVRKSALHRCTFDAASLLNFDPSTIGESLVTESPPMTLTTDVTSNLKEIAKQLEAPIEKLVVACDGIRTALEPIIDMLPSGLKQVLRPIAHLGFLREDVLAATSHIASRNNQPALKEEITKECVVANQFKANLDDNSEEAQLKASRQTLDAKRMKITDEIKRLEEELSQVDAAILANDVSVKMLVDNKQKLSISLKDSIARIRELNKGLIVGSDETNRQIIDSADKVRIKALTAVCQYLQRLPASSPT
ncbi:hypothetical protein U9M48_002694 [Paspalum notatum var. saurae]|uniref:Uncharacterized protein n=1 Tax=Paspalum notatum var. saurae TaxID=547442 RepID=A0AAQ3PRV8_PASNO